MDADPGLNPAAAKKGTFPVDRRGPRPPVSARLAAMLLAAAAMAGPAVAESRAASHWATGSALQARLGSPVDIVWAENPLRRAIRNLSQAQGVAVLVDRRVDPDQKLDLQFSGAPLRDALQEIAHRRGLGISLLGPVVYLGPPEAAARLRTLSALREEDVQRLPDPAGRRFSQLKPFKWDDLATPRDLLKQLAKQNGFELANLQLVPHDLWAAADLPPLSLADRLTLLAIQFDLTFSISADGTLVSLAPLPERVAVVRSYPGGADPAATARNFSRLAPTAEIKAARGRVYVRGLVEDQERIARPHHADSPSKPPPREGLSNKRFTLTVTKKPVGALLRQLAKQLKLELAIDQQALDRAGISLDQLVSFSVKEVTADELFRAAARPAGLSVHRRGHTVEVAPAE
jgi:hypothetical protein